MATQKELPWLLTDDETTAIVLAVAQHQTGQPDATTPTDMRRAALVLDWANEMRFWHATVNNIIKGELTVDYDPAEKIISVAAKKVSMQ